MKKRTTIWMITALITTGCYYDKEEELYGHNGACNTEGVTYSVTVSGLLNSYGCLGCHAGPAPDGNINLQGHTNVAAAARSGRLYGSINHMPGFQPMPQGSNKMSSCDISRIKAWIDAGAPNN